MNETKNRKEKLLLTVAEVAEELGYSIQHTYRLVEQGAIGSFKAPGKMSAVRIPMPELMDFINRHTRKSNSAMSESATTKITGGKA